MNTIDQHDYSYGYNNEIIPKGLLIKCKPNVVSACYDQLHHQWTGLLTRTSRKMVKLIRTEYPETLDIGDPTDSNALWINTDALHLHLNKSNTFFIILQLTNLMFFCLDNLGDNTTSTQPVNMPLLLLFGHVI